MPSGTLLERLDDALLKIPDDKVRHLSPLLFFIDWMIAMIA
jgi:hypothetical protein